MEEACKQWDTVNHLSTGAGFLSSTAWEMVVPLLTDFDMFS